MKQELRRADRGADDYYYRRPLTGRELLPALGAAVGAGLATFYVVRVLTERTPLAPSAGPRAGGRQHGRRRPRGG